MFHNSSGIHHPLIIHSDDFIRIKTSAVSALSHMLRRYTSLNHLSSAAQAVLINPTQVAQMISDLNRVDFKNVQVCILQLVFRFSIFPLQEQAAWVCQCDDELVHKVENSFKVSESRQKLGAI